MKRKIRKLAKEFKPYYNVWIAESSTSPIITKKVYSYDKVRKLAMSKGYMSCELITFNKFVYNTLNLNL